MNTKAIIISLLLLTLSPIVSATSFKFNKQPIKKVDIVGNKNITDRKLKGFLLTKQNSWYNTWGIFGRRRISRTNLIIDERQIKRVYGREGFLFAQVSSSADYYADDSSEVEARFTIEEDKRVFVDNLEINGGIPPFNNSLGKITDKIKINQPLNQDLVIATGLRIRDFYADKGYPVAKVATSYEFSYDSLRAVVVYDIAESSYVHNGDITIVREGKPKTEDRILMREVLVKKDDPYNRSLNYESQQRLYSSGLLKYVSLRRSGNIRYEEEGRAYTNFRLVVSERKANFINFRTGVERDPDFDAVFTASASWGNRNLWGTGRKLILQLSHSLKLERTGVDKSADEGLSIGELAEFWKLKYEPVRNLIQLNYIEPWFMNYRLPLSISMQYKPQNKYPNKEIFFDGLAGETSLLKELNRYTNVRFSARIEFVDIHEVDDEAEARHLRLEGDNSIRRRLSVYGQRDTRDNILAPQRGSYSYVSADYVGHYLGGDFSYIKGEFYWSRFQASLGENIIASRFRIGALKELGAIVGDEERSSSEDRFTLGGANTVRGFAENSMGLLWDESSGVDSTFADYLQPKGGKLLLLANLELRRPLFWRFGGAAFIDAGNVFYNIKDFKLYRIETTAGLGFHFFTPIGPIRLDGAVRVKKKFDLGDSGYHLTILYAF